MTQFFDSAASRLPGWRDILAGEMTVPAFRERYVLGTAAGLNALAGASHMLLVAKRDASEVVDLIAEVDWRKHHDTGERGPVFFEGTVVQAGKVISSRTAFEPAAARLFEYVQRSSRRSKMVAVDESPVASRV